MTVYLYLKEDHLKALKKNRPEKKKVIALGLLGAGVVLILSTLFPILKYEVITQRRFLKFSQKNKIISPLVFAEDNSLERPEEKLNFKILSNWFPQDQEFSRFFKSQSSINILDYTLDIPRLGITNAHVKIGGENLDESLIHFDQSPSPGKEGNVIIFGHSVLPQFFNPKIYTTIFSTLPTLEKGDEILVKYDGILYKYAVEEMITALPEDLLELLSQEKSGSVLTLVTCVPPGTYWKRLLVKARLVQI